MKGGQLALGDRNDLMMKPQGRYFHRLIVLMMG